MLDPIPPPPQALYKAALPLATRLSLPTLPYHVHEVLLSLFLYQSVQSVISPLLSARLFPKIYPHLNRRTRINWDVHVVSLLQSLLINTLALWVMFFDQERKSMGSSAIERIYGYTGASGLIQGFACGYFVWDLIVSTRYFKIFGLGIWFHAVTALCVFGFGFRPFANYYGPVFILYELSSPFLNVHWFCDKLNLTGSKLQWYNGMVLLGSFFLCRLCWGTYNSFLVFRDVYATWGVDLGKALHDGQNVLDKSSRLFGVRDGQMCLGKAHCLAAQAEVTKFLGPDSYVPVGIVGVYVISNTVLNALNFYWFGKMIETVRKRFQGDMSQVDEKKRGALKVEAGGRASERRKSVIEHAADSLDRDVLTGPETPAVEKSRAEAEGFGMTSGSTVNADGASEIARRRKDL